MENAIFKKLNALNVNDKVEQKSNGAVKLSYLSWAWAWGELVKEYPDAVYEIERFDGKPYFYDENLGYMVFTKLTIDKITHEMWLPVMDGSNKAMKKEPYKYTTKYGEKTVESASMFDINKTIMRCLVKNIAMFGLGLYIYAGEDLPENVSEKPETKIEELPKEIIEEITLATGEQSLKTIYESNKAKFKGDTSKQFVKLLTDKKMQLKALKGGANADNK